MPDWFDDNAPQSTAAPAADWFNANAPEPTPADTKTFADHLMTYWHMVNPAEAARGMAQAALTPVSTIVAHAAGNGKLFDKAVESFKKGDYSEAARHGFSYLTNSSTLGTTGQLDEAGTDLAEGRIGEGIAKTAAIATNTVIAPKVLGAVTGAATEPNNLVARGAVKFKAALPDASTVLSTVEKAATLSPAVQDAVEMVPGAGAPIAATARTVARGARTAQRVLNRLKGTELEARPVAQPGIQDPAAVEPLTPTIDTSTELTPEAEARIAARQTAGPSDWFEENAPPKPQPYPGQTDPAAVQPMTPAIDEAVAATPIRPGPVSEPAPQTGQPAVEAVENNGQPSGPVSTPETKTGKFALTPGEGTHLDLQLKEGEVPTAKDYQAQARKVWAGHMATRLNAMGVTPEQFGQMTQSDVDALAKDIGIKASSPEKIALVMDKLQSQPNVALPSLQKATEQSAKPMQKAAPRKPAKRATPKTTAQVIGDQLMRG